MTRCGVWGEKRVTCFAGSRSPALATYLTSLLTPQTTTHPRSGLVGDTVSSQVGIEDRTHEGKRSLRKSLGGGVGTAR